MYKVVGADRREYGPVSRETLLEWIAQGRANAQTIARFEDGAWKPLATFDEFKAALGVTASTPNAAATPTTPLIQTTYVSSEPPLYSGIGARRETNICSVVGLIFPFVCCCCCYIGPTLGIIFSAIGLSQIRANPTRYSTDESLPKAGLVIAIIMLIVHIFFAVFRVKIQRAIGPLPQGPFNI
jgi:hypothetical protein